MLIGKKYLVFLVRCKSHSQSGNCSVIGPAILRAKSSLIFQTPHGFSFCLQNRDAAFVVFVQKRQLFFKNVLLCFSFWSFCVHTHALGMESRHSEQDRPTSEKNPQRTRKKMFEQKHTVCFRHHSVLANEKCSAKFLKKHRGVLWRTELWIWRHPVGCPMCQSLVGSLRS